MISASHQEEMVKEGILDRLLELIASPELQQNNEETPELDLESSPSIPTDELKEEKQEQNDNSYMDIFDDIMDNPRQN
jgi:hypothetical protein